MLYFNNFFLKCYFFDHQLNYKRIYYTIDSLILNILIKSFSFLLQLSIFLYNFIIINFVSFLQTFLADVSLYICYNYNFYTYIQFIYDSPCQIQNKLSFLLFYSLALIAHFFVSALNLFDFIPNYFKYNFFFCTIQSR